MPTPPTPMTTTVSPGRVSPIAVAEPQPVETPQPTNAALSSGMSFPILTTDAWCTVTYGLKVPNMHIFMTRWSPRVTRYVSSAMAFPVSSPAPASHRFCRPTEQGGQVPQAGMNAKTTWSPTSTPDTPGPTLVITPAPSW